MRLRHIRACVFALVAGLLVSIASAQEGFQRSRVADRRPGCEARGGQQPLLKIVTLDLDVSKDKVAAAKTHRYPAMNIYAFGSQLLAPISFVVPEGQFGTYPGIGPIPAKETPITTPIAADRLHLRHRLAAAAHPAQDQPARARRRALDGANRAADPRTASQHRQRHAPGLLLDRRDRQRHRRHSGQHQAIRRARSHHHRVRAGKSRAAVRQPRGKSQTRRSEAEAAAGAGQAANCEGDAQQSSRPRSRNRLFCQRRRRICRLSSRI